jgi:polar amino acid transport system substrate-binding protein
MRPYLYFICCLIGLEIIVISPVYAETLRVGFRPYPPLMIEESKTGIYYDIFNRISAITGISFAIIFAPNARHKADFEQNIIDIEAGINPDWRKTSKVPSLYTTSFSKVEDIILFRPENYKRVDSPIDLTGEQVGIVRGYIYPRFTSSFKNNDIERIDLKDGPSLLKFFAAGRIDYIFINKKVVEYWMLNNPDYHRFEIGDVISSTDVMLRVHPSKKHLLPQLNAAIEELVSTGEIERIYAQYR